MPSDPEPDWTPWRAARDFEQLCGLGLRFLRGEPVGFPGWLPGELDEESEELAAQLARANAAGFLTLASQPAGAPQRAPDGGQERRRAFVFGFARAPLAERLSAACERARLWARSFPANRAPGADSPSPWPVAEREGQPFLLVGDPQGPAELALFAEALGPGAALEDLSGTRYLVLVDPEWGRPQELWRVLDEALGPPGAEALP